jgi:hypothetical protein
MAQVAPAQTKMPTKPHNWLRSDPSGRPERVAGARRPAPARLEQVIERLAADAPNMERPGADLIAHYLSPDRLPARE